MLARMRLRSLRNVSLAALGAAASPLRP